MAKRSVIVPLLLLPTIGLWAQPVIDQADAPEVGDVLSYIPTTFVAITDTGAGITWDLSMLGNGTPASITFLDPAATGHESAFPTANLALDDGNSYLYLRKDATGLYSVGLFRQMSGFQLQAGYTNEEMLLPYPCTYQTAFTDTFAYSYLYQGNTVQGNGYKAYSAVGFGTLQLPYATIQNVLMLRGTSTTEEVLPGTDYIGHVNEVVFYRPGIKYFLLRAVQTSSSINGQPGQPGAGLYYATPEVFAGLKADGPEAIGIDAWPVPATQRLNISYGVGRDRKVKVELLDATGKTVRYLEERTHADGIHSTGLDVEGLPAGIYLLSITDGQGLRGTRKVVIEQ